MPTNRVILDTHVLIWLMNGEVTLAKKARALIEQAHKNGTLFLSAISVWEMGMLESKQRIILNKPCIDWIKEFLRYGIKLLALTPEIALESCQLPGYAAGDPADRIIIATARVESLMLLTADAHILDYGEQKLLLTMNATT